MTKTESSGAGTGNLPAVREEKGAVRPSMQTAVALAYQTGDTAPRVVASGRGLVAEQIIARAREHGVFVHESKELVALLMKVNLDESIPPALYRAVAELLAWLYHIESAQKAGGTASPDTEFGKHNRIETTGKNDIASRS